MAPEALLRNSYRIIDANFNRTKEGLRVCEDIVRFHLGHRQLTIKFKKLRHQVTAVLKKSHLKQLRLFQERDPGVDVAKTACLSSKKRTFKQIFMANSQRTKEALRVLEEFLKLWDHASSKKIQSLRFSLYSLEKETIEKFPALLDP